jgi:Ca2+-binding EF-hand superfamily protein
MEEELKVIFQRINKSRTGKISREEMRDFLKTLHSNMREEDVNKTLSVIGNDGISYERFAGIWDSHVCNNSQINVIEEVFLAFDRDKNGVISKDELKAILLHLGMNKSDKEIDKMFAVADINNDGGVSLEEFKELMNKEV